MADDRDARIAQLEAENAALSDRAVQAETALAESLEQQTATAGVLGVIAASPADLQRVLDTIAESAARLCHVENAAVWRRDGQVLMLVAYHGPAPAPRVNPDLTDRERLPDELGPTGPRRGAVPRILDSRRIEGRAVLERAPMHVGDILSDEDGSRFPYSRAASLRRVGGWRASVVVPLLREGEAIGALDIFRRTPGRFTDQPIRLLETFADQAVIAIENARLFGELERRSPHPSVRRERLMPTVPKPTYSIRGPRSSGGWVSSPKR
jgi:GAF domain-containing protein